MELDVKCFTMAWSLWTLRVWLKVKKAAARLLLVTKSASGRGRCFNCNEKGHFAKDCPRPKREKMDKKGKSKGKNSTTNSSQPSVAMVFITRLEEGCFGVPHDGPSVPQHHSQVFHEHDPEGFHGHDHFEHEVFHEGLAAEFARGPFSSAKQTCNCTRLCNVICSPDARLQLTFTRSLETTRTWPLLKRCSETKCVEAPLSAIHAWLPS